MPIQLNFQAYNLGTGPASATALKTAIKPAGMSFPVTTPQIVQLWNLFLSDPGQQRMSKRLNGALMTSAQRKAQDLATRKYFAHTDPSGYGPNYLARQAGYVLASNYGTGNAANNIESLCAGPSDAAGCWAAWLRSTNHKCHVLGENDFYREQYDVGIGFANVPGSPFTFYWVLHVARN